MVNEWFSFFLSDQTFIFSSFFIALFRTSSTMLIRSCERGHSHLAPNLMRKGFSLPLLSALLAASVS